MDFCRRETFDAAAMSALAVAPASGAVGSPLCRARVDEKRSAGPGETRFRNFTFKGL